MTRISCFGLHDIDGVNWLVQGQKDFSNALGLPQGENFKVTLTDRACPHNIDLKGFGGLKDQDIKQFEWFRRRSQVLRQFLPTVEIGSTYVVGTTFELQSALNKMTHFCSPVNAEYQHILRVQTNMASCIRKLQNSNILRSVVSGFTRADMDKAHKLIHGSIYTPSRLILSGQQIPLNMYPGDLTIVFSEPDLNRWIDSLDIKTIKMLGARYLFEQMRRFSEDAYKGS